MDMSQESVISQLLAYNILQSSPPKGSNNHSHGNPGGIFYPFISGSIQGKLLDTGRGICLGPRELEITAVTCVKSTAEPSSIDVE